MSQTIYLHLKKGWYNKDLMEMVAEQKKQDLRKQLLRKLLSLTKEEIKERSINVERRLRDLPIYKEAKLVMVYYPLRGEVDFLEMIRKEEFKRFCFPVMDLEKKNLSPFEISNIDYDFVLGPFRIMQPDTKKAKEVDIGEIDMVIVPGLAFDYAKSRLGRGGGFYDRFLKRIEFPTRKVGVAFNFQILKDLPNQSPLDERVDFVVSESSVI